MNLKSYLKQSLCYIDVHKKGVLKNFLRLAALLKKRPQYWCFHVNFGKVLRTPVFIKHSTWKYTYEDTARSSSFRALKEEGSDDKWK